jgi:phytanoyl-CoA hydroxylase
MGFVDGNPPLQAMAEHPGLAGVLQRLLGATPRLYQDMAMIKPPGGREKPWHQDRAYFNLAQDTPVAAAWIALDAATPENGCMRLIPGEHRRGPVVHFMRRDWQICDAYLRRGTRRLAAPMEAGDCLLFDALLPHGTPCNDTALTRWALQYHYAPVGAEAVADEERLSVFGSEGKDVTC